MKQLGLIQTEQHWISQCQSEQQRGVVLEEDVGEPDSSADGDSAGEYRSGHSGGNAIAPRKDTSSAPGSGKILDHQAESFPELTDAVARAVALPPSASLQTSLGRAIAQFPERVRGALACLCGARIDYLKHQQQKREIQNPVGYLHEAIVAGWNLSISQTSASAPPIGFAKWFDWAKAQGGLSRQQLLMAFITRCMLNRDGCRLSS